MGANFAWTHTALMRLERETEARAAARQVLTLSPKFIISDFTGFFSAGSDVTAPLIDAMRKAGLPE